MRFLLKIAFWLALIAFFLPAPGGEREGTGVNYFGAFLGAREALTDMGGFCERSPAACAAGRDVGTFVANRVGDGLAYGFAAVRDRSTAPEAEPAAVAAVAAAASPQASSRPATAAATPNASQPAAARPDPMQTAALAAERVREAAGLAPFAMPAMAPGTVAARTPEPALFVPAGNARAIPLPTPRP